MYQPTDQWTNQPDRIVLMLDNENQICSPKSVQIEDGKLFQYFRANLFQGSVHAKIITVFFHKRHCHCMNPVFPTRRKSKPDVKREVKKTQWAKFHPLKTRRGQNPVHHGLVNQSLNQCTKLNFTTKPQGHMKVVLVDTPTPLSISMTVQEKIIRSYLSICRQNRSVN